MVTQTIINVESPPPSKRFTIRDAAPKGVMRRGSKDGLRPVRDAVADLERAFKAAEPVIRERIAARDRQTAAIARARDVATAAQRDRANLDRVWNDRANHQRQQLRDQSQRAAEFYGRTAK